MKKAYGKKHKAKDKKKVRNQDEEYKFISLDDTDNTDFRISVDQVSLDEVEALLEMERLSTREEESFESTTEAQQLKQPMNLPIKQSKR